MGASGKQLLYTNGNIQVNLETLPAVDETFFQPVFIEKDVSGYLVTILPLVSVTLLRTLFLHRPGLPHKKLSGPHTPFFCFAVSQSSTVPVHAIIVS